MLTSPKTFWRSSRGRFASKTTVRMAKKGKIEQNQRRAEIIQRYAKRRKELVAVVKDPEATSLEKREAQMKLRKMPRDASAVRAGAPRCVRRACRR